MKKVFKFIGFTFLALFVLGFFIGEKENNNPVPTNTGVEEPIRTSKKESTYVTIGEILKTDKFEVTVNNVALENEVKTGNPYSSLKQEEGVFYLILDIKFKNIDKESRTIFNGNVIVVSNSTGEALTYDRPEHVFAKGWGLFFDSINPGISKKTKLVYKLPNDLSDVSLYYVPYSAPSNTFIALGTIS